MKLYILTICLLLILTGTKAQCPRGSIELKKGKRDWVKDYKNLKNKYKAKVAPLDAYFLDKKGMAKECIDYSSFTKLAKEAKQVLGPLKLSNKGLLAQIEHINKINPNGFTQQKEKSNLSKPSASQSESAQTAIEEATADQDTIPSDGNEEEGFLGSTQEEQLSQLNEEIKQLESNKQLWIWVSSLLAILFISACGLLVWFNIVKKRQNKSSHRKRSYAKESTPNTEQSVEELQTQLIQRQEEVTTLKNQNILLKQKLAERQPADNSQHALQLDNPSSEATATTTSDSQVGNVGNIPKVNTPASPPVPIQFYLSTPTPTSDGMGTFSDKRQMQFDPIKSVYRFELIDSEGIQATFLFESSAGAVSGALDYPETYLQPACEYSRFDSRANRIITNKKGWAVKEGDKWRVTHKAQIRFA
ncbi:hypothetical protein GCM10028808_39740 [Spirosoma migulaei]